MKREVVRVALCGLLVTCLSVATVVPSFASEAQSETQGIVELLDKKPVLESIAVQLPQAASLAVETQKWNNKAVSNIEGESAIYSEESEESAVVGKMYTNTIVNIEEKGEIWSKISSGEVTGYIKNELLAFGSTAVERANAVCPEHAVIEQEGVEFRVSPEAEVKATAEVGTQYPVVAEEGQWLVVQDSDETNVYVSKDLVSITRNSQDAKTVEQIAAEEEAARIAAEEEAARIAAEEAKRAAEEAAKEAERKAAEEKKAAAVQSPSMTASVDDRTLLAALIYCEAGAEPYEGKVAVGAVVLNRVRSPKYPNTIKGVIYQKGQFGPASTGKLERVIASGKTTQSCYAAADAALAGENPIGNCLHFGNGNSGYQIGSHYFH